LCNSVLNNLRERYGVAAENVFVHRSSVTEVNMGFKSWNYVNQFHVVHFEEVAVI
jgi:hypothetical protein